MPWPDGMVTGSFSPTTENSELVSWSEAIVTPPLAAESVAERVALCPTVTLPKLRIEGDTVNCGPETPVPATDMGRLLFSAVLTTVNVPVTCPAAVGLKRTGNWTLLPGASVIGKGKLPNLNSLPCFDLEVMFRDFVPVFLSLIDKELEEPTSTRPK